MAECAVGSFDHFKPFIPEEDALQPVVVHPDDRGRLQPRLLLPTLGLEVAPFSRYAEFLENPSDEEIVAIRGLGHLLKHGSVLGRRQMPEPEGVRIPERVIGEYNLAIASLAERGTPLLVAPLTRRPEGRSAGLPDFRANSWYLALLQGVVVQREALQVVGRRDETFAAIMGTPHGDSKIWVNGTSELLVSRKAA